MASRKPASVFGREIHRDPRPGRDRAHHLDVEHDLAVRPVRIAGGAVGHMIDRHRGDRRRGHIEPAEISAEIRGSIAAAELDEPDALSGAGAIRITVKRRDLRRRV